MVLPMRISEAIAAECVMPEQPMVSTRASSMTPFFTLRVSLQAPCCGAHQPTPCVKPEMSLISFAWTTCLPQEWAPGHGMHLCNRAHMLYFSRVNHCKNPFHCLLASAGRRKKMTIFPPGSGKSAAKRNSRILTVLYRYSCGMSTWISTGFRTKCHHAARFPRTNSTKAEKTAACAGHAAEWDPKYYWPAPSPP